MIVNLEIVIFNQLEPSSLTHVQLWLGEDIFETFMVSIDIAHIVQQIMSPDFQSMDGVKQKLAPRYVGPFHIIGKSGAVAYKIQLPPEMSVIFNVFHVSQLKKCLWVPEERVPLGDIKLESDLTYEEKPVRVIDTRERVTRSRVVKWYKVMWSNQGSESDATWEREDYLREGYKELYQQWYTFQILG
jgi:hypothetical protein